MYKKDIKKINNNTYFYKDNGAILIMNFTFIYDTSKINCLKAEILSDYLNTINTKYDSLKKIKDRKSELYSPTLSMFAETSISKSVFNIDYKMIEPSYVKDDYFDESLDFLYDMIFNPYFVDNKLDKDRFSIIKSDIYNYYINTVKELNYEVNYKYDKTVLKGFSKNIIYYDSKEELKKDLDSITDQDIIDFYKMLINNHYKTVLFGNFNRGQINKILNKIKFNETNTSYIDYKEYIELDKEYNEFVSKEYTQSALFITYRIKNEDKYSNRWYISTIGSIMSGLDGFLYQFLRYKYGLVYSCSSFIIHDSNIFTIQAFIDKKNKDKTIDAIKDMLNDLRDINKVEKRLNMVKQKIKERIYLSSELSYNVFNVVYDTVYRNRESEREYIKRINNIQAKDIVDFFSELEDENIFFYVGDKDE